jgi:2-dehydro-3-deoxygalactonokinase
MLQQLDPADNYYFLSGLLIGDELAYLQQRRETIVLAAPPALLQLYRIALEFMLPPRRLVILEKDTLEKALLAGQHKILQLYEKSKQLSLETF